MDRYQGKPLQPLVLPLTEGGDKGGAGFQDNTKGFPLHVSSKERHFILQNVMGVNLTVTVDEEGT